MIRRRKEFKDLVPKLEVSLKRVVYSMFNASVLTSLLLLLHCTLGVYNLVCAPFSGSASVATRIFYGGRSSQGT